MCSIPGDGSSQHRPGPEDDSTGELGRLGRAIDELADQQMTSPELPMQEIAARLARMWQMVAELDPELARRLAGYGR